MNTFTIRTPEDAARMAAINLGFAPEDAVVILPIGAPTGAPTARLTLSDSPTAMVESFRPAFPHWSQGVLVVVFTDAEWPFQDFFATLLAEEIPVVGHATVANGTGADGKVGIPELDARHLTTREEILAEAARVDDPELAVRMSIESYRAGDGARAWAYHDRAVELGADAKSNLGLFRVWIGCLACYNNGLLVGEWFDAAEAGEVTTEDVHATANLTPGYEGGWHEELWVMDLDNAPAGQHHEMSPDEAQRITERVSELEDLLGYLAIAMTNAVPPSAIFGEEE